MVLEPALHNLATTLSDLIEQRRAQWPDMAGRELEKMVLCPLEEVIKELQRVAAEYDEELHAALEELADR